MRKIGVGVIGTGFAASSHAEALRRLPGVELVAVAGSTRENAERAADEWGAARAYGDYRELLADDAIGAVHDCTPNHLHADVNAAVLEAGKHVLSEKPLALDSGETAELLRAAAGADVVSGVCFNYRHYPLVRQLKALVAAADDGPVHFVRGAYLQDWLLHETDWNWRLETEKAGASRAVADIGSHWLDLAEHVSGDRVAAVCADVGTLHAERSRPAGEVETFAGGGEGERTRVAVSTEDFASVLLRFESGARGAVTVSQVTAGRKNRLLLELDAGTASYAWDQEEPNRLWIGRRDGANSELLRDPSLLVPEAAALAHYPGGHQEGWPDALRNLCADFYAAVAAHEAGAEHESSFAAFADAHRTMRLVEAILASDRDGGWVDVRAAEAVA